MASDSDTQTVDGEKDHLYYITKAKEKLQVCLSNANHSPEFKQSIYEQLQELTTLNGASKSAVKPMAKKSLRFQEDNVPDTEIVKAQNGMKKDDAALEISDVSSMLEKSLLQEQLDAKENENRSLKQALAMYKAQIEMQRHRAQMPPSYMQTHAGVTFQQQQYMQMQMGGHMPPQMMQQYLQQQQHQSQQSQQQEPQQGPLTQQQMLAAMQQQQQQNSSTTPSSTTAPPLQAVFPQHMRQLSNSMVVPPPNNIPGMQPQQHPMQNWPRPCAYGSNPMTPPVMGTTGMETPSDLWWDSFSPQPSFENYFRGLARHIEQVREESGEGEAPTLRDPQEQLEDEHQQQLQQLQTPTTPVIDIPEASVIVVTPKSPGTHFLFLEPLFNHSQHCKLSVPS